LSLIMKSILNKRYRLNWFILNRRNGIIKCIIDREFVFRIGDNAYNEAYLKWRGPIILIMKCLLNRGSYNEFFNAFILSPLVAAVIECGHTSAISLPAGREGNLK